FLRFTELSMVFFLLPSWPAALSLPPSKGLEDLLLPPPSDSDEDLRAPVPLSPLRGLKSPPPLLSPRGLKSPPPPLRSPPRGLRLRPPEDLPPPSWDISTLMRLPWCWKFSKVEITLSAISELVLKKAKLSFTSTLKTSSLPRSSVAFKKSFKVIQSKSSLVPTLMKNLVLSPPEGLSSLLLLEILALRSDEFL